MPSGKETFKIPHDDKFCGTAVCEEPLENVLRRRAAAMHKVGVEIEQLANEVVYLSDESKKTLKDLINLSRVQIQTKY